MHIRKPLLFVLGFVLGTTALYAQGPMSDRVKALKVAFITEQLYLTPEEAQAFWPLYNQHEEKRENFRRREHSALKAQRKAVDSISPQAAAALLEDFLSLQEEKYNAERDFITEISALISPKKTLLLLGAEKAFKKRLLLQYRKRRGGR